MYFFLLLFISLILLIFPYYIGIGCREIFLKKSNDKSLSFADKYLISYAYGVVSLTYLYLLFSLIDSILSIQIYKYFGIVCITIGFILIFVTNKKHNTQLIQYKKFLGNKRNFVFIALIFLSLLIMYSNPYVYDSGQLGFVAGYTSELQFTHDRGMHGYSALILLLSSLFKNFPIPFVASSIKILIIIIFFYSFLNLSRYFFPDKKSIGPLLILIFGFFSSTLGLYGFSVLGKDSILGIAFMFLFFSLWINNEKKFHFSLTDQSFIFLASVSIGIICIPFFIVFFIFLYLGDILNKKLFYFFKKTFIFGGPILIWITSTAINLNYLLSSALILLLALLVFLYSFCIENIYHGSARINLNMFNNLLNFVPIFFLLIVIFFPFSNYSIDPIFNYQWSSLRPPLDPSLNFFDSLTNVIHTERTMSKILFYFGWFVILISPIYIKSNSFRALAIMPFFLLLFCFLHVEYDLHIIRYRLLWDIYKDIPQWLSGFYVSLGFLIIYRFFSNFSTTKLSSIFILAFIFLALFPIDRKNNFPLYDVIYPLPNYNTYTPNKSEFLTLLFDYTFNNSAINYVLYGDKLPFANRSLTSLYGHEPFLMSQFTYKDFFRKNKEKKMNNKGLVCFLSKNEENIYKKLNLYSFSIIQNKFLSIDDINCSLIRFQGLK